jgi:hypothetical protein
MDPADIGSLDRSTLKSEAQRFLETAPSRVALVLFGNKLPTAHTDLSVAFYLLHTVVGNGAMIQFGICFQWRNEHLKPRMLLFFVGKRRYELSAILATALCTLRDGRNSVQPLKKAIQVLSQVLSIPPAR